jgi:hypothetical protein
MPFLSIDIYQLFVALLTTALLQEFAIKPSVEFLRKYYHKAKTHLGNQIK